MRNQTKQQLKEIAVSADCGYAGNWQDVGVLTWSLNHTLREAKKPSQSVGDNDMIIHYTDDIRSIMSAQDMRNIAMSYAEIDEIPISDYQIQGMLRAADEFDYLDDDFLYWVYALAMIEGIIEDDDDNLYSLSYELCGCYPPPDSSIFTACAKSRLSMQPRIWNL